MRSERQGDGEEKDDEEYVDDRRQSAKRRRASRQACQQQYTGLGGQSEGREDATTDNKNKDDHLKRARQSNYLSEKVVGVGEGDERKEHVAPAPATPHARGMEECLAASRPSATSD